MNSRENLKWKHLMCKSWVLALSQRLSQCGPNLVFRAWVMKNHSSTSKTDYTNSSVSARFCSFMTGSHHVAQAGLEPPTLLCLSLPSYWSTRGLPCWWPPTFKVLLKLVAATCPLQVPTPSQAPWLLNTGFILPMSDHTLVTSHFQWPHSATPSTGSVYCVLEH